MDPQELRELSRSMEQSLKGRLRKIFREYGLDLEERLSALRWKPLVLVIGNYSSGKSTFINELIGKEIQRTGQAPTDDSFTIITSPEEGEEEGLVPGSTVISMEELPFGRLRRFGEGLISHLWLKRVRSPFLEELAIVDTPGMLDSVTEKDRGYDYLGVVGELAKCADCILLMFDPHKAGTIKETYEAIRGTLPSATGEDRVLYCLNRIDECENLADLIRSYGTLCWNLSQMTGRKDMPRIFLTYAPDRGGNPPPGAELWEREREELKEAVARAPRMRVSHMLQHVDKAVRELGLLVEAMEGFRKGLFRRMAGPLRWGGVAGALAFLAGDLLLKAATGHPESPLLSLLLNGSVSPKDLILPGVNAALVLSGLTLYLRRLLFPRYLKAVLKAPESLVELESEYRRDLWTQVRPLVLSLLSDQAPRFVWMRHSKRLARIERFLAEDLKAFYRAVE